MSILLIIYSPFNESIINRSSTPNPSVEPTGKQFLSCFIYWHFIVDFSLPRGEPARAVLIAAQQLQRYGGETEMETLSVTHVDCTTNFTM